MNDSPSQVDICLIMIMPMAAVAVVMPPVAVVMTAMAVAITAVAVDVTVGVTMGAVVMAVIMSPHPMMVVASQDQKVQDVDSNASEG